MKTFWVVKTLTLQVEVAADDEEEAMSKADDINDLGWSLVDCDVYAQGSPA